MTSACSETTFSAIGEWGSIDTNITTFRSGIRQPQIVVSVVHTYIYIHSKIAVQTSHYVMIYQRNDFVGLEKFAEIKLTKVGQATNVYPVVPLLF